MLMSHLTFSVGRDLFTANQSEKHMFTVILKLRIYSCKHSLLYTSVLSISLSYARIYLRYALEQQTIIFTKTSSFTKGSQSIHILWLVIAAHLSFFLFSKQLHSVMWVISRLKLNFLHLLLIQRYIQIAIEIAVYNI